MKIAEATEQLKQRWKQFAEKAKKPAQCIFCAGLKVWWNGKRERSASLLVDGVVIYLAEVVCRRVKCGRADCGKSWTLRPPGLFPQRHYQLCVTAQGLSHYLYEPAGSLEKVAQACTCSERTVARWVNWTALVADPQGLERKVLEALGHPVLAPLRSISARFARFCCRQRQNVLARAGQVLCLLEALGQARGYEPPGLRSVLSAVVAGRYRLTTYRAPVLPDFAWRQWAAIRPILSS
jgi:hypothetical protein